MKKLSAILTIVAVFGFAAMTTAGILTNGAPDPAYPSLELWLDAGANVYEDGGGTDPAEDGDDVLLWKNRSTVGGRASDASNYSPYGPILFHNTGVNTINGKPVLTFPDADWYDMQGTLSVTTDKTFVAVLRDAGSADLGWAIGTYGSGAFEALGMAGSAGPYDSRLQLGDTGNDGTHNIYNTPVVGVATYNGVTGKGNVRVNGDNDVSNKNVTAQTQSNYAIGNRAGSAGWPAQRFVGDVAEVFIYNGVLTTNELTDLEVYLVAKYGIGSVPALINQAATNVTATSASMNGSLNSTGATPTFVWLYWGDNDGQHTNAAWDHTNSFGQCPTGTLTTNIAALSSNTTYCYRYYAANSFGTNWASPSTLFTTLSAPVIANAAASHVTPGSADMNGNLTRTGGVPTFVWLYWGYDDGQDIGADWDYTNYFGQCPTGTLATNIAGLFFGTTYHYRYCAANAIGTNWASPSTNFTTLPPERIVADGEPNPTYSSLELWLDAGTNVYENEGGTDPAEDGDDVLLWKNKSNIEDDASDASNYSPYGPIVYHNTGGNTINGKPVISFPDADWYALQGTLSVTADKTFVAVLRDAGSANGGWIIGTYGNGYEALGTYGSVGANDYRLWLDDAGLYGSNNVYATPVVAAATYDDNGGSDKGSMWVNGIGDISNGNVSANTESKYVIGNRAGSAGWPTMRFVGDVAEVFIYNGVLTAAELNALGRCLQAEYGIAGSYTNDPDKGAVLIMR